jgi:hypothetical protein
LSVCLFACLAKTIDQCKKMTYVYKTHFYVIINAQK